MSFSLLFILLRITFVNYNKYYIVVASLSKLVVEFVEFVENVLYLCSRK